MKWYQDKVRKTLTEHVALEKELGKTVDYSIPAKQAEFDASDPVCQMLGPEVEW